jgi:ribose-phosphate pyrophosphokinase
MLSSIAHARGAPFVLLLPYLPAGRSDHPENHDDPLGVKVYADFINAMNPQQVIGIDPHSPVVNRYMRNLTVADPWPLTVKAMMEAHPGEMPYTSVIAPDKGAWGRASSFATKYNLGCISMQKHRDQATGRIESLSLPDNVSLDPKGRYLVVDDICDGGRTFMELAKYMQDRYGIGPDQLGLWVTHGIFSGNAPQLRGHYANIYTTDSHPGYTREHVATTVVHVEELLHTTIKEF